MKVALVYDRVNKWGGAERVLLALNEMFPEAPLYTSVYSPESAPWARVFPEVLPSFLQKIPFASTNHEFLAAFMPLAFESFDFSGYDLVISVTSEAAKGIITPPETKHVCYCLTPTRYLWSKKDFYFRSPPSKFRFIPFLEVLSRPFVRHLEKWDRIAAQRPDVMVAISGAVKERIKKYYRRESQVIFPGIDVDKFKASVSPRKDFFLLVSRLTPYKRVDLAIKAFNLLGYPLVIVGVGSEEKRLKKTAGKNIVFTGELTEGALAKYYRKCRSLILPQDEDFGLVAVEAQAAGAPVIAFRSGGALDTVIEGETGVFFDKQTPGGIIKAVKAFEKKDFNEGRIRENARRFSKERFKRKFSELVSKV